MKAWKPSVELVPFVIVAWIGPQPTIMPHPGIIENGLDPMVACLLCRRIVHIGRYTVSRADNPSDRPYTCKPPTAEPVTFEQPVLHPHIIDYVTPINIAESVR